METEKSSTMKFVVLKNEEELVGYMEKMGYEVVKIDLSQSISINPFELNESKPVVKNAIEKHLDENERSMSEALLVMKVNREVSEVEDRF